MEWRRFVTYLSNDPRKTKIALTVSECDASFVWVGKQRRWALFGWAIHFVSELFYRPRPYVTNLQLGLLWNLNTAKLGAKSKIWFNGEASPASFPSSCWRRLWTVGETLGVTKHVCVYSVSLKSLARADIFCLCVSLPVSKMNSSIIHRTGDLTIIERTNIPTAPINQSINQSINGALGY